MKVRFGSDFLRRLETDPNDAGRYSQAILRACRRRIAFIRAAPDERDFYQMNSLSFERLKGNRDHQYSMVGIEDYH